MSVTLVKATDGQTHINPGVGMNSGTAALQFIGGMPVQKVTGALIRVSGGRVDGVRVRFLVVNGNNGSEWIMENGKRIPAVDSGPGVREWLRLLVAAGLFSGILRLR